ncbi:MAG: ATP synthase F1 subunit gamma [Tyzzerella sp.]|uniref:ATP synthase gamma chain n=1 Tax=Candidatus Fimicola merdigallinarum TaxID=2840819 RepID=A0A9D9H4H0_9FIRM|nr:ATP synthase F1 subunit gamma [Candidatus Fimicola merdigallinarum]
MASVKEIQDRMKSISDTMKITNAMYLISSSKLIKAKRNMERVQDYFNTINRSIGDILHHMPDMEHRFLEPFENRVSKDTKEKQRAYIVITADKGLAGAYNLNVEKMAEREYKKNPNSKFFVIGQVGRNYFLNKHMPFEEEFFYSSQKPSLQRSRNITTDLIDVFKSGEIQEVYIIFTHVENGLKSQPTMMKLLPLSRDEFSEENMGLPDGEEPDIAEEFFPDAITVFNQLVPITMHGIIFSALTESYCAELHDRMVAMDGATKSGREMLQELRLQYNRLRQGSITQEITEVIAGAKSQRKKRL